MDEIKEALKQKEVIFGTNEVIKKLRTGKLKKVIVASNCKKDVVDSIEYYAGLGKVDVVKLEQNNEQLAIACKKPFNISVIGY